MLKERAISALSGSQNFKQKILFRLTQHFSSSIVSIEMILCKSILSGIKILKVI